MSDNESPEAAVAPSRRSALQRLFTLAAMQGAALPLLIACAGDNQDKGEGQILAPPGSPPPPSPPPSPPAPTPSPPPPPPSTPPPPPTSSAQVLGRLKAALATTAPVTVATALTVTQGAPESIASSFGSGAKFIPPLPQDSSSNLSTTAQVYGRRRDLWPQVARSIGGNAVIPMAVTHSAGTLGSTGRVGVHFIHTGSAFELLVSGVDIAVTLVADGNYVGCFDASQPLVQMNTSLTGGPFASPDTTLRFDFGSQATRHVSLYSSAGLGACALVIAAGDAVTAWDRSAEPSFAAIADSYGGVPTTIWGFGGLFFQAALALNVPHVDLDAIGGTGYAPNSANSATILAGNAYDARVPSITASVPDLFVVAGGINDNNTQALPPYDSAAAAAAGFQAAVTSFYTDLRARLPFAVLAALGPWQPPPNLPASQGELDKASVIKTALATAGGNWIWLDNMNGGWSNSSGASSAPSASDGPWQTLANASTYIDSDNVHPNVAGAAYLSGRLATALRAGIQAL